MTTTRPAGCTGVGCDCECHKGPSYPVFRADPCLRCNFAPADSGRTAVLLAVLAEAVAATGLAHPRDCGMHRYVPVPGRPGIVGQGPCDCWVGRAKAVIEAATPSEG
jgi:hypothetical protein